VKSLFALIRHGAYRQLPGVPSALQPFALTDEGINTVHEEAQLFKCWLKKEQYDLSPHILSSTSLRAWQTAKIYCEVLKYEFSAAPVIDQTPALCERNVGAVANLTVAQIEQVVNDDPRLDPLPDGWKSDSHFQLPFDGAESLMKAGERVASTLIDDAQDGLIHLHFGHGASFRHAAFHKTVIQMSDIARLSMHYGHPIVFQRSEGGFTRLYGDWKIRQKSSELD